MSRTPAGSCARQVGSRTPESRMPERSRAQHLRVVRAIGVRLADDCATGSIGYRPHPPPPVPLPTCSYPSVAGRSLRSLGLRAFARGAVAPSGPDGPVGRRGDADGAARSPSPPVGAERAGVRWGCLLSHSAWRDAGTDALRRAAHHGPANREGRGSGSPRPRRGGPPPACRASRRRACSSNGTGCGW